MISRGTSAGSIAGSARVAVIGGGIAGLVAAYELSRAGLSVTLFERASRLGGLAGSFELGDGRSIEKYYHFICKPDRAYFKMLDALGIAWRLRWRTTDMGLFYKNRVYTLGDPLSLLAFPHFSLTDKLRFVLATARSKVRGPTNWRDLEHVPVREWLVAAFGPRVYDILYRPLLESKFREHLPEVSAAWMWARFYRLGNSRTITQKERIGYLVGGSQAYIDALEAALRGQGVQIRTGTSVEQVMVEDGRAVGISVGGELRPFEWVISTVPIPHTAQLFSDLDTLYFRRLRTLKYIGVMVMLVHLDRRFSKYFWLNVSDPRLSISGIIEYTNLNPYPELDGEAIIYIPQYLDASDPMYAMTDQQLFERYCRELRIINPAFNPSWVRQYRVHRDRFAQPLCQLGFSSVVPSIRTPIPNVFLTDSYQLHPHDRSIADSTELGTRAARLVLSAITTSRYKGLSAFQASHAAPRTARASRISGLSARRRVPRLWRHA